MKKTFGQALRAIRSHPDGIRDFLDENPEAIPYGKRMGQAIAGKKIPLHGTPYEIAQRAYEYERGDKVGLSLGKIFNEMNKET
jgi:hypothetical protein